MPNEESKNIRNIFIAVMLTGLFIFLIGVTLSVKFLVLDRHGKESTYAIITNITRNSTSVRYTVNDRTYNKTYSVYSSSYYKGKKVKVYYNKSYPRKSYIASIRYVILVVPGIGILTMGISCIGFIYIFMKYYSKYY